MASNRLPNIDDFSVHGAQQCAEAGQIEQWVHTYLNSGYWANLPLSKGLKLKKRFWLGPVKVRLDNIDRLCGPEENMIYKEPKEQWDRRLRDLERTIDEVTKLPPLIINSEDGTRRNEDGSFRFVIADGSHRLEALRNLDEVSFYCIIWFETRSQREAYLSERHKSEKL